MARTKRASSGYKSTSSAASKFSKAQKRTYVKVNQMNARKSAGVAARRMANSYTPSRRSGYTLQKPRNVLDQAHESFFDIGRFLQNFGR